MSKAQGKFDFSVHHPCNVNQTKKDKKITHVRIPFVTD